MADGKSSARSRATGRGDAGGYGFAGVTMQLGVSSPPPRLIGRAVDRARLARIILALPILDNRLFPCPARPFCKAALTLPAIPWVMDAEMARSEDAETVGARIARLRRERGMTQVELAERLHVSQPV